MFEQAEIPQNTYYEMDYWEVDELCAGLYGFEQGDINSPTCSFDQNNDTIMRFYLEDRYFCDWDEESVENFLENEDVEGDTVRAMMKELAYFGIIPQGTYLVNVSW